MADQRPIGVLRIRRQAEGFDGPAAEALEEMLIESAKHIALAMKKDEDDRKAITDQLTGLFIKRHFLEVLEQFRAEAAGEGKGFALVMCDLDHFKKVNDTHGHKTGDVVLQGFAQVLLACKRDLDVVARYGGEEFVVLCEETDTAGAKLLAERIRKDFAARTFAAELGPFHVTCSLGVATLPVHAADKDRLVKTADQLLYKAKQAGRNRTVAAQS